MTELGIQVDPARDVVEVEGRQVSLPAAVYLALHKPPGYVSSAQDERRVVFLQSGAETPHCAAAVTP